MPKISSQGAMPNRIWEAPPPLAGAAWTMLIRMGGLDMEDLLTFLEVSVDTHGGPRPPRCVDGRGDWIRTSDLHTPSVMRYQAALRPDLAAASRQRYRTRQGGRGSRVARGRRKGK